MSKSDLAWMRPKLAELCGLEHGYMADTCTAVIDDTFEDWHPDEDESQSIRCAESLGDWEIRRWTGDFVDEFKYEASVYPKCASNGFVRGDNDSIARAICLAIAAALDWKEAEA